MLADNPYRSPQAEPPTDLRPTPGEAVYEAQFQLALHDVRRFQRFSLLKTRRGRMALARSLLLPPLLLFGVGLGTVHSGGLTARLAIAAIFAAVAFLAAGLLFWRAILRSAHVQIAALPPGPSRIIVSEAGIRDEQADQQTSRSWRLVQRLLVGPDGAYFYVSPVKAMLVPARAFASERQFAAFVATARRLARAAGNPLD